MTRASTVAQPLSPPDDDSADLPAGSGHRAPVEPHAPNRSLTFRPNPSMRRANTPWSYRNVNLTWTPEQRTWDSHHEDGAFVDWLHTRRKLRVFGECWGMSAVSHPATGGDVIISPPRGLEQGPRVRWSSQQKNAVVCTLGCTFEEVHAFLEQQGGTKALANQPGYSRLSVMGTLATGGHGSGLSQGPLESLVESVTLAAVGTTHEHLRFERAHPDFARVVHHMGRLGPVLEVELRVRDAFRIAEQRHVRVLGRTTGDWRGEFRALVREATELQLEPDVHSAELWIAPYARRERELSVALGVRRYTSAALSTKLKRPPTLRYEVLQTAGRALATLLTWGLQHWVPHVLETAVRSTHTPQPVVMSSREGLDFGAPNVNRMGSIEAGIELNRGADAIIAALELLARLAAQQLYVFSPLGVRFVASGLEGSLSPHAGRAQTLHLEVPTLGDDRVFHGPRVLAPLQRLLAAHFDGRPHWGQRVYLTPTELSRLWPRDSFRAMTGLVERLDPNGVFANQLVDETLACARSARA